MIRTAFILCLLCVRVDALDHGRMADVFDQWETPPGWDGRDGAAGERGPFQFREITWRQHMGSMPFAMARHPAPARACALKHIAWLAAQLEARGVPATVFNVGAAWNAGLDTYTSGRAPVRAYRYAANVEAIYFGSLSKKEPKWFPASLGAKGQKTVKSPAAIRRRWAISTCGFILGAGSVNPSTRGAVVTPAAVATVSKRGRARAVAFPGSRNVATGSKRFLVIPRSLPSAA